MNKKFGYRNEIPLIDSVRFTVDSIIINLLDGRKITLPINRFPDIQKLTPAKRRRYDTLAGTGLMFDDSDTVYHISDFLGALKTVSDYSIEHKKNKTLPSLVAEPGEKYNKK